VPTKRQEVMNEAIRSMLIKYSCSSSRDYENALKEIIQEVALLGLWRGKFFEKAAFYGGSALRIVHELDRFSEDLDFSLLEKDDAFHIGAYKKAIVSELSSFGFSVEFNVLAKSDSSPVKSAFVKANTIKNMISVEIPASITGHIQNNQVLKVKMEVDANPPGNFGTEAVTRLLPIPFTIYAFNLPCLFAGKIHALLCRKWETWVKGRDWYDFVWLIGRNVPVHINHLKERLVQSGHWQTKEKFDRTTLIKILKQKIMGTDFNHARADVAPFLRDSGAISLWSGEFFIAILDKLKVI
jgi:predicted nucleotidyltransferase component of viral defense system